MFRKPKLALGILQRQITYINGFPRWGCFVACILTAIQRSLNRTLRAHEIQQWYWQCVKNGHIRHNDTPIKKNLDWYRCFVSNYLAAFNLGMQMFGGTRCAMTPSRDNAANLRIYRWKTLYGWHFTYGSPQRNLHDPDPRLRLLRRDGQRDAYIYEKQTGEKQHG